MIPREDMILIFDVKKESLVFVFSAAAEFVESRVNGPDVTDNEISSLLWEVRQFTTHHIYKTTVWHIINVSISI